MNKELRAHLALLIANIIYGANYSIAKFVMPEHIKPAGFILLRVTGAVILFWFVGSIFIRESVSKKDIRHFALLAVFGVAINQLLFFSGLNRTSPVNASIMMVSNPILVLLAASFILKEKMTMIRVAGILLGFAGAAALLLTGKDQGGNAHWYGDLMVLLNSASWGIYLVLVKPFMSRYNTVTIVKWCFLFGWFYVFPFGFGQISEVSWSVLSFSDWGAIAFVVVGSTFFAYLLNVYALKDLSPAVVSAYIYLQPVLAALFAYIFLDELFTAQQALAAIFIFLGVYLVSRPVPMK